MTKGKQLSTLRLISDENKIIKVGNEYLTHDGRTIIEIGEGLNTNWKVEGIDFLYTSLFDAYYDNKF